MAILYPDFTLNSNGGTEQMCRRLEKEISPELMDNFQIIPSRLRGELDESKIRLYWAHDLPQDPEADLVLKNEGWRKFHRIIFVSNWQYNQFIQTYQIPPSRCQVLLNAIDPIERTEKSSDKINIIYHTTPHRGLSILIPVFKRLSEQYDNIHLDVFSSFKLYGWDERDKEYEKLFAEIDALPNATNHGAVPHSKVRKAISQAHIFAYPSIHFETSCLSLMEAMSGGLICVHPNLAALPETAANWTFQYQFQEEPTKHASIFHGMLEHAIQNVKNEGLAPRLDSQSGYANLFYNWQLRKLEWENFLKSLLNEDRGFEKITQTFRYSV